MKNLIIYILGSILLLAGVYTFYTSSAALFGWFGGSPKDQVFIKLTQVTCFVTSILYIIAGVLFFFKKKLTTTLLFVATVLMFVGYIAMLFHINSGKFVTLNYVGEMLTRTTSTMLYAATAWYIFTRTRFIYPPGHDAKSFRKLMREHQSKERQKMKV